MGLDSEGRAVDTRQGTRADGVHHHEQETGLPSKWGSLFIFKARGCVQILDYVCVNIKREFLCAG